MTISAGKRCSFLEELIVRYVCQITIDKVKNKLIEKYAFLLLFKFVCSWHVRTEIFTVNITLATGNFSGIFVLSLTQAGRVFLFFSLICFGLPLCVCVLLYELRLEILAKLTRFFNSRILDEYSFIF